MCDLSLILVLLRHHVRDILSIAAGPGFEPGYHSPEECVLPLDDPAKIS